MNFGRVRWMAVLAAVLTLAGLSSLFWDTINATEATLLIGAGIVAAILSHES